MNASPEFAGVKDLDGLDELRVAMAGRIFRRGWSQRRPLGGRANALHQLGGIGFPSEIDVKYVRAVMDEIHGNAGDGLQAPSACLEVTLDGLDAEADTLRRTVRRELIDRKYAGAVTIVRMYTDQRRLGAQLDPDALRGYYYEQLAVADPVPGPEEGAPPVEPQLRTPVRASQITGYFALHGLIEDHTQFVTSLPHGHR